MTVLKSTLITRLSKARPDLRPYHIEVIVNTIFDEIASALSQGRRVELRDFGIFSTKQIEARVGRNPKTGELVPVDKKIAIHFKPGKGVHEKLNRKSEET